MVHTAWSRVQITSKQTALIQFCIFLWEPNFSLNRKQNWNLFYSFSWGLSFPDAEHVSPVCALIRLANQTFARGEQPLSAQHMILKLANSEFTLRDFPCPLRNSSEVLSRVGVLSCCRTLPTAQLRMQLLCTRQLCTVTLKAGFNLSPRYHKALG